MNPHAHDPVTGFGLLSLAMLLDVMAHYGLTILSAVAMACGILYGGFNCYIAWRNSEATRARFKTQCFREWEAAKDRS